MFGIVGVDFGMAFEADGNRIINLVSATISFWFNVVGFHLNSAKLMADAATSVAFGEEFRNFVSIKTVHACPRVLSSNFFMRFSVNADCDGHQLP